MTVNPSAFPPSILLTTRASNAVLPTSLIAMPSKAAACPARRGQEGIA